MKDPFGPGQNLFELQDFPQKNLIKSTQANDISMLCETVSENVFLMWRNKKGIF